MLRSQSLFLTRLFQEKKSGTLYKEISARPCALRSKKTVSKPSRMKNEKI